VTATADQLTGVKSGGCEMKQPGPNGFYVCGRGPVVAVYRWRCYNGHTKTGQVCGEHNRVIAPDQIGCAACLAAGVDGVPMDFELCAPANG
jgi:hypothetical protein